MLFWCSWELVVVVSSLCLSPSALLVHNAGNVVSLFPVCVLKPRDGPLVSSKVAVRVDGAIFGCLMF